MDNLVVVLLKPEASSGYVGLAMPPQMPHVKRFSALTL